MRGRERGREREGERNMGDRWIVKCERRRERLGVEPIRIDLKKKKIYIDEKVKR